MLLLSRLTLSLDTSISKVRWRDWRYKRSALSFCRTHSQSTNTMTFSSRVAQKVTRLCRKKRVAEYEVSLRMDDVLSSQHGMWQRASIGLHVSLAILWKVEISSREAVRMTNLSQTPNWLRKTGSLQFHKLRFVTACASDSKVRCCVCFDFHAENLNKCTCHAFSSEFASLNETLHEKADEVSSGSIRFVPLSWSLFTYVSLLTPLVRSTHFRNSTIELRRPVFT